MIDAFEAFLEDLSNWYIRRSRRRFYSFDEAAFRTLWTALVQALRVVAPVLPFLSEHLWQALVTGACPDAPASVHLAGWPARGERPGDEELLAEIAAVRDVVQLGPARARRGEPQAPPAAAPDVRARGERGRGARRARSPRSCASRRSASTRGPSPACSCCRTCACSGRGSAPSCPRCAPRSSAATSSQLDDGRLRAAGEVLEPDEVIRGERVALEGWAIAEDDGISVAFDTTLDDELRREGRVLDLVHALNAHAQERRARADRPHRGHAPASATRTCWRTATGSPTRSSRARSPATMCRAEDR